MAVKRTQGENKVERCGPCRCLRREKRSTARARNAPLVNEATHNKFGSACDSLLRSNEGFALLLFSVMHLMHPHPCVPMRLNPSCNVYPEEGARSVRVGIAGLPRPPPSSPSPPNYTPTRLLFLRSHFRPPCTQPRTGMRVLSLPYILTQATAGEGALWRALEHGGGIWPERPVFRFPALAGSMPPATIWAACRARQPHLHMRAHRSHHTWV